MMNRDSQSDAEQQMDSPQGSGINNMLNDDDNSDQSGNESGDGNSNNNNSNMNNNNNSGMGGGGGNMRRNRRNDDQLRVLIPSRIAGAIIGKGGQHIQKMRSQYKATVSVDDCQGPERTILLSAEPEAICNMVADMLKYFEEKDDEVDVRILIHQSLAGCVIGKGGAKIKEIRDRIGCRVLKVFSNVAPQSTDRVVQCIGKQDHAVQAVREIMQLIRETPIKGTIHNYDPINFDDLYADEYGGFGQGNNGFGRGDRQSRFDRQGRFDRRRDRFDDGGRRGGGGGGGAGGGDNNNRDRSRSRSGGGGNMNRDRDFISPWANDNMMGGGFGAGGGGNFGAGGGNFGPGGGGGFGTGGGGFGNNNFGGSGGFGGGNQNGGGTFGPGGNFNAGGGPGGAGMGGGFGSGGGGGGNQQVPFGGNNANNGMGGGNLNSNSNNFGGGNNGNMNGGAAGNNQPAGPGGDGKNSTQVTIPKDLAGAIIGKAGGRIRRIRNESGAYITIDEPLPGSNDRIITISGNPKQIQMAQYLLQQSVHENRRKF